MTDLNKTFYLKAYPQFKKNVCNVHEHFKLYGESLQLLKSKEYFMSLYPLFDINIYKKYNNDLRNLCDEELMAHFHGYGRFELRTYND